MEKEHYPKQTIRQLIYNVVGYSQQNGDLLAKYSDEFYLSYFDHFKITQLIQKIPNHQKQLQISQFIRLFLSSIAHHPQQTLYLTISLIKLYKKIKQDTCNQLGVKFTDFTSYLCNKITQGDPDLVAPMKQISIQRIIPDTSKIRDIDINPPNILSKVEVQRPKITKDKNKKDKKLEQKKPVSQFIYSTSLNSIIVLGRLSSSISIYDPKQLKIKHKIIPTTSKLLSKDVAILSIAYCQRQQRIGCILNNIGIIFWQASDNFTTQKVVGISKGDFDMKAFGDKIYYLNLFNQWITSDKDTIYFWDIKEELVSKIIHKDNSVLINDICQVNHIRGLLVSYNLEINKSDKQKDSKFQKLGICQQKYLILYKDYKQKSKLLLPNPGCHSICYNPSTQLIVCLGYQYAKTFDINQKSSLKTHASIQTCICNIPQTSMMISGDDLGNVKLWQLNYMRCLQGIKISTGINQISCSNNMLIYSDSRINTMPLDFNSKNTLSKYKIVKDQQNYGICSFFRKDQGSLWIITRKQGRQLDINTGRIKNIFILCNNQQDVSAAAELANGFLIGTSKGQMSKFTFDGQRKWRLLLHDGEIYSIKVDIQNSLILTLGEDNTLLIYPQKSITSQQLVKKKITFQSHDINLLQICPYSNLLLIASNTHNQLSIWNYNTLKLACVLDFLYAVTCFVLLTDKFLFAVATIDGGFFAFHFTHKEESKLQISLINRININELNNFKQSIKKIQIETQQIESTYLQNQSNKISYISKLSYCQDNNMVIGASPKGFLYSFEFDKFYVNSNYRRQYQPSAALKRPMKESFEHQLLKNQTIIIKVNQLQVVELKGQIYALWNLHVHKDNIYFLNTINLQKKYAFTFCIDGYFKIIQLSQQQGSIVCSHKINFPLPVKWNIDVQNYCDLKNKIHQAIVIIDSIIKNFSYQLTLKEQIHLNITPFMEKMVKQRYQVKHFHNHTQLISQQFTQADVKQIASKQTSLKTLQAYKRLQLIKKRTQPDFSTKPTQSNYHYSTSPSQKESIRNFLQPSHFPKLLSINPGQQKFQKSPKTFNLLSRLDDIFANKDSKQKQKQNKNINSYNNLQKSDDIYYKKNNSGISNISSVIQGKTVKEILSSINGKLSQHKKCKNMFRYPFGQLNTL